jgi:hypothetical protein
VTAARRRCRADDAPNEVVYLCRKLVHPRGMYTTAATPAST